MAAALGATMVKAKDVDAKMLDEYDLIGFGSGIYNQRHHISMFELINRLPVQSHKKAFVFSTNTFGIKMLHKPLKQQLTLKGFDVIAEFACCGYFSFFNWLPINRNRPDEQDLENAKQFIKEIIAR